MPFPTFLICGAPKAGTTSLYYYLQSHPNVCMSSIKETDYFQHNYEKGIEWYKSLFNHHKYETAVGEASPGNMIHPQAAKRIAKDIPDAKLIFILRNPIERAYSQYWYGIYRGTENVNVSFSSLIRKKEAWGKRIVDLGMYYEQISRYDDYFPSTQIMMILYEDFCSKRE